jgi:predicted acyltransferase
MKTENKPSTKRLYSLDALRGFDMFWITGGAGIFIALANLTGWPFLEWWAGQLKHVEWHGFRFYDMIFPLFLFIAGISFPFSAANRSHDREGRKSLYKHIIKRGLTLVLLGIIFNNGIKFDFPDLRYGSVLGRIGLAWMFAALIFMNTRLSFRIVWFWSLLIGYWLLLVIFPANDLGSTDIFSREGNLASYIDRILMPGRLYLGNHDPEGLFATIPAISTALLGMFTGEFVRSGYPAGKPFKTVLYMVLAAVALMITGKLWSLLFPINKNLWSSSFVCWVGGISLLLFSLFYLVIDVWNIKKWSFFLVVIGVNPITIYLASRIINFRSASQFLFGGFSAIMPEAWKPLIDATGYFLVGWLLLYFLYRKKIYLKV